MRDGSGPSGSPPWHRRTARRGSLRPAGRVRRPRVRAGDRRRLTTAAPPLSPADALQTFHLPPGYRLELVASEPMVVDPVWMDQDPDGRLWVVEMRGFMPNFEGTGEDAPVGQVVVLEDTDDDGRMDKRTVFLDGLVLPRTVKVLEHGVLVIAPPHLLLARDTNGDLKADTARCCAATSASQGQSRAQPQQPDVGRSTTGSTRPSTPPISAGRARARDRADAAPRPMGHLDGRHRARLPQLERRSAARRLLPGALPRAQPVRGAHARRLRAGDRRTRGVGGAADAGVNRGYREGMLRADGSLAVFQAAGTPPSIAAIGCPPSSAATSSSPSRRAIWCGATR